MSRTRIAFDPESLDRVLHRLFIGAPEAGLREEDRCKVHEMQGFLAEIAATVNVSERTLRRRLLAADLSYAALLDQERMRRALELLSAGESPMARVADASGFSDTRSLRRAIKRWTGQTPSQLRRHGD